VFKKILIANRGDKAKGLAAQPDRLGTHSVLQASSLRAL
jgi:acetyl/propionyl-CoA carboxylase alpha subunit